MRDLNIPEQRHPEKAHRPDNAQPRKPSWIRVKAPTGKGYNETRRLMRENNLVTVCEEAGCPNVGECWSQGHATMMIMGEVCTRACTFCNIATGKPPEDLDVFEPGRVAHAVEKLGLNHVVITSVDRDDIKDGGATCLRLLFVVALLPLLIARGDSNGFAFSACCDWMKKQNSNRFATPARPRKRNV